MLGVGNRGELNIVLRVKDDGTVHIQKFGKESERSFGRGKRGADSMRRSVSGLERSLITAIASVASFAVGGRLIDEFKAQEQAVAGLDASLISMGRTTPDLSAKLQALANQLQRDGIIGDDNIVKGQSFLATYSEITDDLLPRTTRVMADLAAKMGGDTVQAANLLGKASLGMTGELARVGITLSESTKKSKDYVAILDEIEAQVGGMNAALARTATGGITQFSNAWGDVREQLGQVLALSLSPYLRELSKEMSISDDAAQTWAANIRGAIESIVIGVAQVVDIIDDPVDAIADTVTDLWAEYTRLPGWAQEVGIVGALLGGKKGLLIIGALTAVGDETRTTAEWWSAFSKDEIGFFEWFSSGNEEAAARLQELRDHAASMAGEIIRNTPNIADGMLGEGGSGDTSAADRVRNFFARVNEEVEKARVAAEERARALAEGGGSSPFANAGVGPSPEDIAQLKVTLAEQLLALDESFLSEQELLESQYLEKQLLLDEALDIEAQSYQAYYDRRIALDAWYTGQKGKLITDEMKLVAASEKTKQVLAAATTDNAIGLLQALAGRSKAAALALLAIEKAKAIAGVIVNTLAADATITAQLGIFAGPAIAVNHALAALNIGLIAATGLVQAASLSSGSGPSPVYQANPGTGTPATGFDSDTERDQISPTAPQGPRELRIVIDMGSKEFVRDVLIPELIEAEADGVGTVRVIA